MRTDSLQIIPTISIIVLSIISCQKTQPKGMYKYYSGTPIGDTFFFEQGGDYIKGDTIFYKNNPKGLLLNTKRRMDGVQFITVKSIETNKKATYIKK